MAAARRGIHPDFGFKCEGHPINRMLTSSWLQARLKAGQPQARLNEFKPCPNDLRSISPPLYFLILLSIDLIGRSERI